MNEIVNKFLLAGDKFVPYSAYSACGPFTKNLLKDEFKNLKKQEIQCIFIKMNPIRLVFNMI